MLIIKLVVGTLALLLTMATSVAGVAQTNPTPADEDEAPLVPEGDPTTADVVQEQVSESVLATGRWLDSFFDDERYTAEVNRTRVKLGAGVFLGGSDGAELDLDADIRISVPNTERRLSLLIGGSVDDDGEEDDLLPDDDLNDEDDDRLSIGAQYFLIQQLRRNLSVQSSLRFRSGRPVLGIGPRYRETVDLGEAWTLRLTNAVRYFTDDGWQWRGSLDLERAIGDDALFRIAPGASWDELESGVDYRFDLRLFTPLSRRRGVEYQVDNRFETRPSNRHVESALRVRYRQRVWREWLTLEVAPELALPRDEDWDATPGILFRLEVLFGEVPSPGGGP